MNRRRRWIQALAAIPLARVAPVRAQAPGGGMRGVGILAAGTHPKMELILASFFNQMRQLGWIEGQNIAYDRAYADDLQDRLPALAIELVRRKPELIYAPPAPAAVAARQATQTIPIVFGLVADPVAIGLVSNLAHPGGNITGMAAGFAVTSIVSKRIEMLREILPGAKRLGLIGDSTDPSSKLAQQALSPLLSSLGFTFTYVEAANPAEFEAAAARLFSERIDAVSPVGTAILIGSLKDRLIEMTNQRHIPAIAGSSFVDRCRSAALLWRVSGRCAAPLGIPGRQDPQRGQPGRPGGGAADAVQADRQPQGGESAGHHRPADDPAACGQGDRVSLGQPCTPALSQNSTAPSSPATGPQPAQRPCRHRDKAAWPR
jgi:putative ABC transport system substrate-binding protein